MVVGGQGVGSKYIYEYSSWEKKIKKNLNYQRRTSNHVFGMQLLLYKLFWPHGEGHEQELLNMCGCKLDRTRWLDKTNTPSPIRTSNLLTLEVLTGFAGWRSYSFTMCDLSTLLHHKKLQGRPHQVRKRQGKQYNSVLGKVILNQCPTQTYRLTTPHMDCKVKQLTIFNDSVKIIDLGWVTSGGDPISMMD
jgi:hypothetical protein